jgi:ribosome-binding factor A
MAYYRDKRAGSLLHQEISQLILKEIKDPRITGFVTVTDVVMSKDLKIATVYVSILGDEKSHQSTFKGLVSSIGFIKRRLGQLLSLKYMPDIRFKEDTSIERGANLYNKISQISKDEADN